MLCSDMDKISELEKDSSGNKYIWIIMVCLVIYQYGFIHCKKDYMYSKNLKTEERRCMQELCSISSIFLHI